MPSADQIGPQRRINHENEATGSRSGGGPGGLWAEFWGRNVDGGRFYEREVVNRRLDRRPVVVDLWVLDGRVGDVGLNWLVGLNRVVELFWCVGLDWRVGLRLVRLVDLGPAGERGSALLDGERVQPLGELLGVRQQQLGLLI
jgi:hypothetical protein